MKCISRSRLIGCGDVTSKFLLMKCSWILPVIFHYYVSGLIKIFVIIKLYFTPFVMVFSPLSPSPMKYIILNRNGTILCLNYCLAVNRDLLYRMNPQLSLIGPVPLDITAHYYFFLIFIYLSALNCWTISSLFCFVLFFFNVKDYCNPLTCLWGSWLSTSQLRSLSVSWWRSFLYSLLNCNSAEFSQLFVTPFCGVSFKLQYHFSWLPFNISEFLITSFVTCQTDVHFCEVTLVYTWGTCSD